MSNVFDKLFGKKDAVAPVAQKSEKPAFAPVAKPKYDFVEQYTIVDPKKVLNGGYDLWQLCDTVPVVCEESTKSICGFSQGIMLPTRIVMGFLMELKNKPAEEIADPKMRTLSIVHISKNHRVVIGPNFESPKNPVFWLVASDAAKKDWIMYVTPEKNRAIVDALKIHTR